MPNDATGDVMSVSNPTDRERGLPIKIETY